MYGLLRQLTPVFLDRHSGAVAVVYSALGELEGSGHHGIRGTEPLVQSAAKAYRVIGLFVPGTDTLAMIESGCNAGNG